MGIINATPDSFSDGGINYNSLDNITNTINLMNKLGVDYIDIGGESTRPGAVAVSSEEEIKRVGKVFELLKSNSSKISVDTTKSSVAKFALESGATMVNDISGLTFDKDMVGVISDYQCEVVLMHIKGKPQNMQNNPQYDSVVDEVYSFLEDRVNFAVKNGVSQDKIWIDPGIGFGKTQEHNLELMKNIEVFKKMGVKILVGVSRKSFIGHYFNRVQTEPSQRDSGTVATTLYLLNRGVDMVRVHNVFDNIQAMDIYRSLVS